MAEVGKPVPDIKLRTHDNAEITLSQYRGLKWVVISAFPAAFTGG